MNREIRFRGKGVDDGKWIVGSLVKLNDGNYCIYEFGKTDMYALIIDPKTVGQYTGLTDEDGVDIYEGDIVTFDRSIGNWTGQRMKTEHEVYYESHISAFVMKAPGSYIKLRRLENRYIYKVIGNVYEK